MFRCLVQSLWEPLLDSVLLGRSSRVHRVLIEHTSRARNLEGVYHYPSRAPNIVAYEDVSTELGIILFLTHGNPHLSACILYDIDKSTEKGGGFKVSPHNHSGGRDVSNKFSYLFLELLEAGGGIRLPLLPGVYCGKLLWGMA